MKSDHRSVSSDEPQVESAVLAKPKKAAKPIKTLIEKVPGYSDGPPDAAIGGFGLERVFGTDDRTLVPSTSAEPWRWSAALRIKASDGTRFVGTGWFIGPRTLVTAGHCVYMHDHGGFAQQIEVIPGLDGTTRPFKSVISTNLKSVEGWTKKRNSDFDYGAIVLPNDSMAGVGAFTYAAVSDELLQSANLNISGYPADRDGAARQYFHARKIARVSSRRIYYQVDTFGGQSGAAGWIMVDAATAKKLGVAQTRIAVAVHTAGSTLNNHGTRITPDVVANFKKWLG